MTHDVAEAPFAVDQKVRAKITLIDDLSDHGMGQQLCAEAGEILVVRKVYPSLESFGVSHEHVTDNYFIVRHDEIEPAPIM